MPSVQRGVCMECVSPGVDKTTSAFPPLGIKLYFFICSSLKTALSAKMLGCLCKNKLGEQIHPSSGGLCAVSPVSSVYVSCVVGCTFQYIYI